MYILIIFAILTLAQSIFIYSKWSNIQDYRELGQDLADVSGLSRKQAYTKTIRVLGNVLSNFKTVLIIPIGIILFLNLIVSLILGGLLAIFF